MIFLSDRVEVAKEYYKDRLQREKSECKQAEKTMKPDPERRRPQVDSTVVVEERNDMVSGGDEGRILKIAKYRGQVYNVSTRPTLYKPEQYFERNSAFTKGAIGKSYKSGLSCTLVIFDDDYIDHMVPGAVNTKNIEDEMKGMSIQRTAKKPQTDFNRKEGSAIGIGTGVGSTVSRSGDVNGNIVHHPVSSHLPTPIIADKNQEGTREGSGPVSVPAAPPRKRKGFGVIDGISKKLLKSIEAKLNDGPSSNNPSGNSDFDTNQAGLPVTRGRDGKTYVLGQENEVRIPADGSASSSRTATVLGNAEGLTSGQMDSIDRSSLTVVPNKSRPAVAAVSRDEIAPEELEKERERALEVCRLLFVKEDSNRTGRGRNAGDSVEERKDKGPMAGAGGSSGLRLGNGGERKDTRQDGVDVAEPRSGTGTVTRDDGNPLDLKPAQYPPVSVEEGGRLAAERFGVGELAVDVEEVVGREQPDEGEVRASGGSQGRPSGPGADEGHDHGPRGKGGERGGAGFANAAVFRSIFHREVRYGAEWLSVYA